MTFQRKLLLGFALMILPVLLVGAEAIRSNVLERRALVNLGDGLARNRTYAEVETAISNQTETVWHFLAGFDPTSRKEFALAGEVVDFWLARWGEELGPDEAELSAGVREVHRQIEQTAESIFALYDRGDREGANSLARNELKGRLLPALTQINREIYRRARENSVQQAFTRVEGIVDSERRLLLGVLGVAVLTGLLASWLIARSLAQPLQQLSRAMAVVGSGDLDHPIQATGRDEVGELAHAFADMTAKLRQSRIETERLTAQLVQSEKLASIGEMAAAVAHGLRNPLASLRAAAQLVARHPDAPSAREQLGAILEEVDRLDHRISHLLSFSRPAPYHPAQERLDNLIEGLLPRMAEPMREQSVAVTVQLPPGLPDLHVDPVQIDQALQEVVSNALDAMPAGGELHLDASQAPHDGRPGVELVIRDTGRGIPEEALASVCEPFFTTRREGTGLGLAITRRFIEQNGGHLTISSQVGSGTTIRIWLPAAGSPADRAAGSAGRVPA